MIRFRRFRSPFSDKIKFVNVDGALQFSRDLGQQEEASKQDLMEQVRYVQIPSKGTNFNMMYTLD